MSIKNKIECMYNIIVTIWFPIRSEQITLRLKTYENLNFHQTRTAIITYIHSISIYLILHILELLNDFKYFVQMDMYY